MDVKRDRSGFGAEDVCMGLQKAIDSREIVGNDKRKLEIHFVLADGTKYRLKDAGFEEPNILMLFGENEEEQEFMFLMPHTNFQIVLQVVPKRKNERRKPVRFHTKKPPESAI